MFNDFAFLARLLPILPNNKKYLIRKDFVFKTIKKCYGKGNWMGSQGKILKKNFILLEEITSKYFN